MDLDKFLKHINKFKGPCEVCGGKQFDVPSGNEVKRKVGLFMPRENDGGYVMPGQVAECLIAVCVTCGNLRLFSIPVLEKIIGKK